MHEVQTIKPQELIKYSKDYGLPALSKEDNLILSVKYQSKPVQSMTIDELCVNVHRVLLKVHVITGWTIPANEMMDILIDQTIKKFQENYGNVNIDEIEFAFRNNTSVKDWGKSMNLALIDEVIIPYLEKRREVSKIEEQENIKQLPLPTNEPMTDDEFIEMNFKTWQVLKNYGIISVKCYGILVKQYKINLVQADKDELFRQMEIRMKERMNSDKAWYNELYPAFSSTNPNLWKNKVFNECKRKSVENYFLTIADQMK